MRTSTVLLFSGLAAQQVSATWNRNAGHFKSPQYNNNECSDKQQGGFKWEDLPEGPMNGYGDFGFGGGEGGWKCSNSFGKRDHLTKRTFSPKCIKNKVQKDKPATFNCDKKKEGFSVKEIDVSVEYDAHLELHYKMPDNSICKQKSPCKKEGSTIYNTQCGGATSVDVYLGDHDQPDRKDCEIGFHRIDFDCKPPEQYTPPPPPTYSPSSPPQTSDKSVETSSAPPSETPSAPPSETPSPTPETSDIYTPSSAPPSPFTNSSMPVPETSTIPPPPSSETPPPAPPSSESSAYPSSESYSAPPVTSGTPPPAGESSSAPPPPPSSESSAAPPTYGASTPLAETSSAPQSSSPPQNYPPPPPGGYSPPECLPKCMNTWLQINSECKSNTDATCYCKNPDFTKSVIECVTAWAKDDKETQEALQYLIGICAPAVPENPGLITHCPTNIPINPTTPPQTPEVPVPSAPAPSGPVESAPASSVPAPPAETPSTPPAETPSAPPAETPAYTPTPGVSAPPAPPADTPAAPPAYTPTPGVSAPPAAPTETPAAGVSSAPPANTPAPPAPYPVTEIPFGTTTYTVPLVQFVTETITGPGSNPSAPVQLVPGTPAPVPAQTTVAPYPYPSGMATATYPGSTGIVATATPPEFTGAASSFGFDAKHAFLGAALAFFAL
ncbi:hypothetical protein BDV95DRAFT_628464 [Massariosphaeria phaeospora]|uniref:CFEM domain-containing protein n=1 Tax=Massariosphaeria phaeospora TaxID=100035 RepID=A0A7C8IBD0_9PLEO|nr:hypothetical protein BDV95DRAFT_628464 [Massariosphaeria phaeospora]